MASNSASFPFSCATSAALSVEIAAKSLNKLPGIRYIYSLLVVILVTSLGLFITEFTDYKSARMYYLLGVVVIALAWGFGPAISGCVFSVLSYGYFIRPGLYSDVLTSGELTFTLLSMFLIAATMGALTAQIRAQRNRLAEEVRVQTLRLMEANSLLEFEVKKRKESQKKLRKLLKEVTRSNAALESFAKIASHDLQEPLQVIQGYANILVKRYSNQLDEDGITFVGHMSDAAVRMRSLINGILDQSRVKNSCRTFRNLDCEKIVSQSIDNLEGKIHLNSADVTVGFLPVIKGDGVQLVQLFQNIIENALKYRSEMSPQIHIEARRAGSSWEFCISDNGLGIEPEYRSKVFEMFGRLHPASDYPGSGIGLAICKSVVENHGGKIWVDAAPGGGCMFKFTLPGLN